MEEKENECFHLLVPLFNLQSFVGVRGGACGGQGCGMATKCALLGHFVDSEYLFSHPFVHYQFSCKEERKMSPVCNDASLPVSFPHKHRC